jgi:hypothetical protein
MVRAPRYIRLFLLQLQVLNLLSRTVDISQETLEALSTGIAHQWIKRIGVYGVDDQNHCHVGLELEINWLKNHIEVVVHGEEVTVDKTLFKEDDLAPELSNAIKVFNLAVNEEYLRSKWCVSYTEGVDVEQVSRELGLKPASPITWAGKVYKQSFGIVELVELKESMLVAESDELVPEADAPEVEESPGSTPEIFTYSGEDGIISPPMASSEVESSDHLTQHISDLKAQAKFESETKRSPIPYPHENVVFHMAQFRVENLSQQRTKKGTVKSYEVVATLRDAAERTGVADDEILTTSEIEAEYHINKKLVHEYTKRGRQGRPHLTPLDVRLARGGGSSQLLFRRGDIEKVVANPPKTGRPPK